MKNNPPLRYTEAHVLKLKLKSLILDIIHCIDVVSSLSANNCSNLDDWQWQKQLRYYAATNSAQIRMVDALFQYTFEYQVRNM